MPYVIPSMRRKVQVNSEDAMRIVQESMEVHFPVLEHAVPVQPKDTLAYAAKAKEWESKREALDHKERIDKKVAAIMEERNRQEEEEYKKIRMPKKKLPTLMPLVEQEVEVPVVQDEWTTVAKKVRKPKPERQITEEEFNFEYETQVEEN